MKSPKHMPKSPLSPVVICILVCLVICSSAAGCRGGDEQPSEPLPTQTMTTMTSAGSGTAGTGAHAGSTGTMTGAPTAGSIADAGVGSPTDAGGAAGPPAAGSGGANTPDNTGAAGAAGSGQPEAGADAPKVDAGADVSSMAGVGPAQDKALGFGRATTGGGNAQPRSASSLAELQAAVDSYSGSGGIVLEYTGRFDFASIPDPCVQHTLPARKLEIKNKSDVTLLGKDGSAANFGIHIASDSRNIIIRNMTIGLTPGGGDSDMISLEGMSSGTPKDIWIDHNELFSSLADCEGAGDTSFDGMIDVKKGVDNLTISYNYLHDHHKASLHGYSDSDSMPRHVTFDHNLFENIGSRTPLQRHGYSHILNNQFTNILVSGINVRMNGYALVEGNYFQDVNNPVTSRDSDEIGYWELRDNNLESTGDVAQGNRFGITWDDGNKGTLNAKEWTTTAQLPEPLGYAYEADPYACVRDGLRAVAGAGKQLATLTCR